MESEPSEGPPLGLANDEKTKANLVERAGSIIEDQGVQTKPPSVPSFQVYSPPNCLVVSVASTDSTTFTSLAGNYRLNYNDSMPFVARVGRNYYYAMISGWDMIQTNFIFSTPNGHWFFSTSHEASTMVTGTLSSGVGTDPFVARPYGATPLEIRVGNDYCASDFDGAVPAYQGEEVNPVEGVHFVASYNTSQLYDNHFRSNDRHQFRYIDELPKEGRIPYKIVSHVPKIAWYPRLFTDEEADAMIQVAQKGIARSKVAIPKDKDKKNDSPVSDSRTSSQAWLTSKDHPAVAAVINRISATLGWDPNFCEGMQVLRYEVGQKYNAHMDYFSPKRYNAQTWNRAATTFLYLDTVAQGGHTWFPRANAGPPTDDVQSCTGGLKVTPIKGSAATFYDMRPDLFFSQHSLHGGCPPINGTKWGGTLWCHVRIPKEFQGEEFLEPENNGQ